MCICQVYNELEKGNLERFFKYTSQIVNDIIIYDDCSTDGSFEYAQQHATTVIRGVKNDFSSEISHKQQMLVEALKLKADFILWLDTDEVLTRGAKEELQKLCHICHERDIDGISFHQLNIWRSATWRRLDSLYDDGWFVRLWRVMPGISFHGAKKGLHQNLIPECILNIEKSHQIAVLHYGFADKKNLAYKYLIYKSHGQRGYEMLDRLIDEKTLSLVRIPKDLFPEGLWIEEKKPDKISFYEALSYVEFFKHAVFRPKYTIACLIYKSVDWLEFVYKQILKYTDLNEVEFFFVANDATTEIKQYLRENYLPHFIFENTQAQKSEWYINNVYRAYNYAAKMAKGDFIIFINSDMAFSPDWLNSLIAAYDGRNVIASRLVESGKLEVGEYGIKKNFGKKISQYREDEFLIYANGIKENKIGNGGLFMPLFVRRDMFLSVNGYPEGNVKKNSDIFDVEIAKPGEELISGDNILIKRLEKNGIYHHTAFSSIVYHFQEGEKDEFDNILSERSKIEIAICNDYCHGIMGERVLWNYLLESLPGAYPVDKNIVPDHRFESRARQYIAYERPSTSIVIQNASFIDTIDPSRHTIIFLQDDLRQMGRASTRQELNLKLADTLVTNSIQTALSYPEFDFEIIPVGIDADLFCVRDKKLLRKKYSFGDEKIGIFVGSFSETKGWSKIVECIHHYSDITWILVSKYAEAYNAPNIRAFHRIDQLTLSELLNCADFFIIGSRVETQCLAALEANLCDLPVVMPLVGIYRDFTSDERDQVGIFGDNLILGVELVFTRKFSPRQTIIEKGLTVEATLKLWHALVQKIIQKIRIQNITTKNSTKSNKNVTNFKYKTEILIRQYLLLPIFGRRHLNIRKWISLSGFKRILKFILIKINLLDFAKEKRDKLRKKYFLQKNKKN